MQATQPSASQDLTRIHRSIPNRYHYDPDHYERELEVFWYRMWINVCRAEEIANPRDFLVVPVGDQSVVITRDPKGQLHAFHNTCRHRGSVLCTEEKGRFKGGSVVCPYHAWTYSLDGKLTSTPHQLYSADFDMKDYSLYRVAIGEWGGFVFINLAGDAAEPLEDYLGPLPDSVANWHLKDARIGFRYVKEIKANWKLWHENFYECFHCPGVHPELGRIVPQFARGLTPWDLKHEQLSDPGYATLAPGCVTWTMDGQFSGPVFKHLSESEHTRNEQRSTIYGNHPIRLNFFVSAFPDYVHTQRFRPTSPTTFEVTWDYLFEPSTMELPGWEAKKAYELWQITNHQDAQNVEWQQTGLMSGRRVHEHGVFVPQESLPHRFNQWVLEHLEEAD